MTDAITIIFPHQLFLNHPAIVKGSLVILIEETLFFNQYKFHKKKLVLHRASMKHYAGLLEKSGVPLIYIEAIDKRSDIRKLIAWLHQQQTKLIRFCDPDDEWISKRIESACNKHQIETSIYPNLLFMNQKEDGQAFFEKSKTYFQTSFYIDQRKKRNLLLDRDGKPEGGKWSFDQDNRHRYPAKTVAPPIYKPKPNEFVKEAITYVEQFFPDNYGDSASFNYPVTHEEGLKALDDFFKFRFEKFGVYEDAIVAHEHYLHHSVLSPLLNIGLLSPQTVIEKAVQAAPKYKVPLNSLEGFTRQIIGWREYIRIVYRLEGNVQRTTNFWKFKRKIPHHFWKGETGIVPIDVTIQKILATGYCHHIERLMILGNFMLLCEFDPDDVYRWFMELFIDSYDWVMVPNVYGMTQFADGGLMTTKPYISGSNYILKMSNYKKGPWSENWDALFWRFLDKQRSFFKGNQRMAMLINNFDKMPPGKKAAYIETAERYLATLDKQ